MMHKGKTLALALGALTVSSGALALVSDSSSSPYRGIVERNVFNIHDAPPPPKVDPASLLPPPPNIRLQGITDILGRKQVLFKVQLPPKAGAPAKEESFILTVGERQGEIEVLAIDPKAGTVVVRNYGVVTNLSLELNSDKLMTAPPTAPGVPPPPASMAAPGAMAPPPSLPTLPPGKFPRTLRLPGSNGAQNQANPNAGYGYNSGVTYQQPVEQANQGSLEQGVVIQEAQRMKYQQEGSPMANIMPPPPRFLQKELGYPQEQPIQQPQ